LTSADDRSNEWADGVLGAGSSAREADAARTADALRAVTAWLVGTPPGAADDVLAQLADGAEQLAKLLPGDAGASRHHDRLGSFARHALVGRLNPLAPPLTVEIDGDVVAGVGTFGVPYEGPPGCVHGGYIAASFDVILAMCASRAGAPGVTSELMIRYLRPTPLHEELRFEAELGERDGKRLTVRGKLYAFEDIVTAEAEGTFVGQPDFSPGRFVNPS
jgi:acyl-coenzyme A thioesterase PaaI-like protein